MDFNLSLLMGFRNSAPFFYMLTETVTGMENAAVLGRSITLPHPLEA